MRNRFSWDIFSGEIFLLNIYGVQTCIFAGAHSGMLSNTHTHACIYCTSYSVRINTHAHSWRSIMYTYLHKSMQTHNKHTLTWMYIPYVYINLNMQLHTHICIHIPLIHIHKTQRNTQAHTHTNTHTQPLPSAHAKAYTHASTFLLVLHVADESNRIIAKQRLPWTPDASH